MFGRFWENAFMPRFATFFLVSLILVAACSPGSDAPGARIAVAANFKPAMDALEARFEAASDYELTVSTGSTGKLYAQIRAGAPFDIFLAADAQRPQLLEAEGFAENGSRFTYALGALVLWAPARAETAPANLHEPPPRRVAIANPELAPYGRAAQQAIKAAGLDEVFNGRLVMGENIGQAFTYIDTGNAELGFVARSQFLTLTEDKRGGFWPVPDAYHSPIRQDAVLLSRGASNPAAMEFTEFLKSAEAAAIIAAFGYKTE